MNDVSLLQAAAICAAEPIHTPGAVQPFGVLLVVDLAGWRVQHIAGNVEQILGVTEPVGSLLAALVEAEIASQAAALAASPVTGSSYLGQMTAASGQRLDVSAFVAGAFIAVELEPAPGTAPAARTVFKQLEQAAAIFERAISLQALCEEAASMFRDLTGFDRVMVYRFNEDSSGRVLAEARRPDSYAFLHHHFPASDIPQQARTLYLRNLIRVIPDAAYRPAPLRPAWTGPAPLDMSDSSIRSVSPIHLEYLHNMGVRASASISLVKDGALWGLIACHHDTPRLLPYDVRATCRYLAGALSRHIKAREEAESYRQRIRFRSIEDEMLQLLSREGALDEALAHHLPRVSGMMDADGIAVIRGKELVTSGVHPESDDIWMLAAWLLAQPDDAVTASATVSELNPSFARFRETGSGILAVVLSAEEPWVVIWFRAEQVELVKWAGNPHKAVSGEPNRALSPRASFEAWQETVRGHSRRWTLPEVEAARRLRGALLEMRQTRWVKELNSQLTRLLQEQARLVEQKDYLIGEVNHRVQNSLQLVSSFLQLQGRSSDSAEVRGTLEEARRRLAAVALVHRRLYTGSETRVVDGARYIEELCADTLAAMGPEWQKQVSLDLSPILIPTNRTVTLGLVLTELFININKYAYGGGAGPIEVRLLAERAGLSLIVADRGSGMISSRRGYGSRMINSLVTQMGGRMVYEDNKPGLRVVLSAPL
jgi:light-regulated signal transduction histidine kinase (bacteriophytochrome)